jgi:hypothetical protein
LEKVTGGFLKNHRWKFLKPPVTFLKTTGGFILLALESYQRKPGNEPKKGWEVTNLRHYYSGAAERPAAKHGTGETVARQILVL